MHSIAKKFCVTKLFSENCVRDLLHLSLLALSSFGVDLDFDCQGHRWSVVYHVFVIKPMLSHFQKVWSTLHLPRSVFSCWLTTQDISNGTQHQFRLVNIIFCRWNTTNYVTIYRIFFFLLFLIHSHLNMFIQTKFHRKTAGIVHSELLFFPSRQ